MRPVLLSRLTRVASILEDVARLHEAAYPETTEEKKERLEDVKSSLLRKGWKSSKLWGLSLREGDKTSQLSFSVDSVIIVTTNKDNVALAFKSEPAESLAVRIDSTARHLLGSNTEGLPTPVIDNKTKTIVDFEHAKPRQTPTQQIANFLQKLGWGLAVEDTVIKAKKLVPNTKLDTIIFLNYDNKQGNGIFSYAFNGKDPRVLYPFEVANYLTLKYNALTPEQIAAKLLDLSKRAYQRIYTLEELKLAENQREQERVDKLQQEEKANAIQEEEYSKFKALMDERLKEENLEKEFEKRYKKENPAIEGTLPKRRRTVRKPESTAPKKKAKKPSKKV